MNFTEFIVQEACRPIHMNIHQWKMNIDYNKNYITLTYEEKLVC